MNLDLTQVQVWVQQFVDAVKSGNLGAIAVTLVAGWLLWKKYKGAPVAPVAPVTPSVPVTNNKKIDAALVLLDTDPVSPAEKALVAAVALKHGVVK